MHLSNDIDLIPILLGDFIEDKDHMRTQFLANIHQFRPSETIFEITKLAKSSTTGLMEHRRKERNKLLQLKMRSSKSSLMDIQDHRSLIMSESESMTEDQVGQIIFVFSSLFFPYLSIIINILLERF